MGALRAGYPQANKLGRLMAELHVEELKEGTDAPTTRGAIAQYIRHANQALVWPAASAIASAQGLSLESDNIARGLAEGFAPRLTELLLEGSSRSEADTPEWVLSPLPIGFRALDDIEGGYRTCALMWAERTIREVSATFDARGATTGTTLQGLASLDVGALGMLLEAHVLLGALPYTDELAELSGPAANRLERAARARNNGFKSRTTSRSALGSLERMTRASNLGDARTSPFDASRRIGATLEQMRLVVHETMASPLIERGLADPSELYERTFLPLRISLGAHWEADSGLVGGPDTLELADRFDSTGRASPIYFPFILKPLVRREGRLRDQAGWLADKELYVTDPRQAYPHRSSQIRWIVDFGFRST